MGAVADDAYSAAYSFPTNTVNTGGGGMDWMTGGSIALNALGSLFGGGDENKPSYWQDQLTRHQGYNVSLQNEFLKNTVGERSKSVSLANLLARQQFEQKGAAFGKAMNLANTMFGSQIYNPMDTYAQAQQAIVPLENQLQARFGARGLSGGALAGALGNLRQTSALNHLMGGYEKNAFAMAQRDQGILQMLASLS